ncbi:hypothetical protein [uncultured Shewanella sp.]|uniref:hypothetical protein n=1 Tax=uncultured Shewanella sp. TaxID=173975 RepID=UPI00261926ED|nr:hypothetical protein [uncultured Shewanella sp.]
MKKTILLLSTILLSGYAAANDTPSMLDVLGAESATERVKGFTQVDGQYYDKDGYLLSDEEVAFLKENGLLD